jgi:hypothetical protein
MSHPKLRVKLRALIVEAEGHLAVVVMAVLIGIPLILWLVR